MKIFAHYYIIFGDIMNFCKYVPSHCMVGDINISSKIKWLCGYYLVKTLRFVQRLVFEQRWGIAV
jgi:hypothetical protein